MADPIRLIVGLGNPGSEYRGTRHNAGAEFVEELARQCGSTLQPESKFFGMAGRVSLAGHELRLLIPTTFMNRSGKSVAAIANFYKISPEEILIAHDELDIPAGTARFKQGGGHGGHNGLRDIVPALGNSKNFHRLRIGIGHPGDRERVLSYLTRERPTRQEQDAVDASLTRALEALDIWFAQGWDKAVQALHTSG